MENNKPKGQVIKDAQRKFALSKSPDAYIISVHIRNMMATYGEEQVRSVLALFLPKASNKSKKASGE
jgi:hypothetical protein